MLRNRKPPLPGRKIHLTRPPGHPIVTYSVKIVF
jgi:hypothetical protein